MDDGDVIIIKIMVGDKRDVDMDYGNYNENGGNGSGMVAEIVVKMVVGAVVVAKGT